MKNNRRKKKAPRPVRPSTGAEAVALTGQPVETRAANRAAPFSLAAVALRWIPAPIRALLLKDFYVLQRDLRNMSQLVTPLIFGIVYAVMFVRGGATAPMGRGEAPALFTEVMNHLWIYGNVAISLFVGWMLIARLGGMGFSQEGKSYWMIKAAPLSVAQLLIAKYIVAFLPALVLGWAFLLAISLVQHAGLGILLFTLPVVALCIAGNAGLNLAFGVVGANMDWEDPRKMQRGTSGCLGMVASFVYLPLSLVFFFAPAIIANLTGLPELVGQLGGLLLGGVFSLVCAILPIWLVRDRVPRLGEA